MINFATTYVSAEALPPGSTMLPRQAKAITGLEVMRAVVEAARGMGVGESGLERLKDWLEKRGWTRANLTFPNLRVELEVGGADDVGVRIGGLDYRGAVEEFVWTDGEGKVRRKIVAGPCARPDELRLALGLPRLAEFRLPDGRIEVAALPGGEGFGRVEAQVVKRDGRLYDDEGEGDGLEKVIAKVIEREVEEIPEEELVATPDAVSGEGRKQVLAPKQRKVSFTTLKEKAEKERLQGGGK